MKSLTFLITSIFMHVAMFAALAVDLTSSADRAYQMPQPVRMRVIEKPGQTKATVPATPRRAAPKSNAQPAQKVTAVQEPSPAAEHAEPQTDHVSSEHLADANSAQGADAGERGASAVASGIEGVNASDLIRGATIDPKSFVKPRYTMAARNAEYSVRVVAEVLVSAQGEVKDIKFDREVLYGMEERIMEAIEKAKFKPATSRIGMAVDGWVRIPFQLDMGG